MTRLRSLARIAGICFAVGAGGAAGGAQDQAAALERSPASLRPGIRVIELAGTPRARGLSHGRLLASEIQTVVARFKASLEREFSIDPDEFIRRFREVTDFEAAIEKWTPGLLDEVRGIAAGAGLPYDTVYVLQLIPEIWSQGADVLARSGAKGAKGTWPAQPGAAEGSAEASTSTSIAVDRRGSQATLIAQNLDMPEWLHGLPALLRVTDEKAKLRSLVLTVPGVLGIGGLNDSGVGVCTDTLLQLKASQAGLPVAFVVRGVLEKKEWHNARMFLYTIRHASGQNYILGGPDVAHSFECSADRVRRFVAFEGARITWHTNRPLRNEEYSARLLERAAKAGRQPEVEMGTCPRLGFVRDRLSASGNVDAPALLRVLASKAGAQPICNERTNVTSVQHLGATPELHVCPGGPGRGDFVVHRFPRRTGTGPKKAN